MIPAVIGLLMVPVLLTTCKKSQPAEERIVPDVVTEPVQFDTDDPAIWYNEADPSGTLVFGTDKDDSGSIYAFDLQGRIVKRTDGLVYPNNVDVMKDAFRFGDRSVDLLVTVERPLERLRFFSVPDMRPLDIGNCKVFEGEASTKERWPMGVVLYRSLKDSSVYVFVSRKTGPTDGTYVWQYQILPDSSGFIQTRLVRKLGDFSGDPSEIEAVMVDPDLGFVYLADEAYGIRKYHAEPDADTEQIGVFGQSGYLEDREGMALWKTGDSSGYILSSDQKANRIHVYDRVSNQFVTQLALSASQTDGIEILHERLHTPFPEGLLVVMSDDRTFQYYDLKKLESVIRKSVQHEAGITDPR
ncbi:MAG: phytase [Flavobacteriales bacterium]|nr:phytase [Flavobacteriales bacterium]